MYEHVSPEEKLLKLIRRKDRPASAEDSITKQRSRSLGISQKEDSGNIFKLLEKIFLWIVALLLVYIAYEFLFMRHNVNVILKETALTPTEIVLNEAVLPEPKPDTYYTEPIQQRDIFGSSIYGSKTEDSKMTINLPELTKNLRLVGIVLGDTSEAIIEDLELKQTFFLHKGESIKNAIVDDIQESKVILLYGSQKVELVQ